ncbi:MAG TPA: TonB-dependent receptor [Thermoanaerobaculia bacterium]|nr:TonB-dependent receptor [Thermoanaerobaculia bacterium]
MKPPLLPLLLAAASAALVPFAVRAEEPPAGWEAYALARVTVTAEAAPVDETALTVAVTAEEIAARNAKNVAEALAAVPGLRVSAGRKNEPTVYLHGFDQSRVQVLIDGVPYYEANYGRLDLAQIPTDNVARIEVTKGAASVLGGANALGGTINIISRTAGAKPFTELLVEGGDYATGRFVATHGARRGPLSYWLSLSGQTSGGTPVPGGFSPKTGTIQQKNPTKNTPAVIEDGGRRENSDTKQRNAWAKLGWEPSKATALFLNVRYFDRDKGAPPATDAVQVFLKRPAFSQFSRIPTYRDLAVDLDGRHELAQGLTLKAKAFHHEHVDDYESYKDETYSERIAISRFDDTLTGGSLVAEWAAASWSTLRLAAHLKDDTHRERDDAYLPFAESASITGSLGLEDSFTLSGRLSAVAGVSYDWFDVSRAERNVTDGSTGDFVRQDRLATPNDEQLNPMAGLVWRSASGTVVNASLARKSRFPTLSQLYSTKSGNTGLASETSVNATAGVSRPLGANVRVEAGVFLYDVRDLITRNGSSATNLYRNVGKVRMAGLETVLEVTPLSGLTLRADYTFVDAKERTTARVTDDVTNVPRHKAGFLASWAAAAGTRVDLDAAWLGSMYSSLPSVAYPKDPVKESAGYVLLGGKVTREVLDGLRLWVSGRNLLDEDYESEVGFPGVGRSFSFGASATF